MEEVTTTSLQDEILQLLYTHYQEGTIFTAKEGYATIKAELPLNSIVQNSRDLGALLNACNLRQAGDVQVYKAGYNSSKKINEWKLQRVPANLTTVPTQPIIELLTVYCSQLFERQVPRRAIIRWLDLVGWNADVVAMTCKGVAGGKYEFPIARVEKELNYYVRTGHPYKGR